MYAVTQLRVLLVEDNALNRRLVRDVLSFRGHAVKEAECIDAAREALESAVFDLILLDVQVPGGGGERLLEEIRRSDRHAGSPIVAVTAFAMPGDRERFLALGFDGYVSKPIDTRKFGPDMEALVMRKREANPSPQSGPAS